MADTTATAVVTVESLGAKLDAELTLLKARLGVVEATAKTDWAKGLAWVKAQWPHFVTWGGAAWLVVKNGLHFL